jgi:hypothetical protein
MARPIEYGEDAMEIRYASKGPEGPELGALGIIPPKLIYLTIRNFRIVRWPYRQVLVQIISIMFTM